MSAVSEAAPQIPLAERIRDSINRRGVGLNELGAQISERQGLKKNGGQRKLYRWLRGGRIQRPADAELLAELLGEERDYFKENAFRREPLDARVSILEEDLDRLTAIAEAIYELNRVAFRALGVKVKLPELPLPNARRRRLLRERQGAPGG